VWHLKTRAWSSLWPASLSEWYLTKPAQPVVVTLPRDPQLPQRSLWVPSTASALYPGSREIPTLIKSASSSSNVALHGDLKCTWSNFNGSGTWLHIDIFNHQGTCHFGFRPLLNKRMEME
jgi:hypothetical protein